MAASIVQDFTGSPSTSTTQTPQLLVSQPQWVPVSPRSSRRKCTSSIRGSTSRLTCVAVDRHGDLHPRHASIPAAVGSPAARVAAPGAVPGWSARRPGAACSRPTRAGRSIGSQPSAASRPASAYSSLGRLAGRAAASSARWQSRLRAAPRSARCRPRRCCRRRPARPPRRPRRSPSRRPGARPSRTRCRCAAGSGSRTSVRISSCSTAVSYGPRWNSAHRDRPLAGGALRSPPRRGATSQTVVESSAGSAWHSEPPSVPRLRTTGSAITFSASWKIGNSRPTTGEASSRRVPGQRADPQPVAVLADVVAARRGR